LSIPCNRYTYLYGPNGIIPNDTWTMRRFAVMERTSNSERHPYKSVVEDWDSQNYDAWLMEAFDHKDNSGRSGIPEGVERELQADRLDVPHEQGRVTLPNSSRCRCSTSRTIVEPSGSFPVDSRI